MKQFLQQQQMKGTGLSASSSPMGAQSSPPPPPQPKESFVRRYKFMWPLLLTVNLAVGGHFLFPLFDPFNGLFKIMEFVCRMIRIFGLFCLLNVFLDIVVCGWDRLIVHFLIFQIFFSEF